MDQKTNIKYEEGRQDLTITRDFNLPVELLYKAYSEAEFIEQWMGTKVLELQHKNHGGYIFETSFNGAVVFNAHGTIHSCVEDKQIISTFEMENASIGAQMEFIDFEKLDDDNSRLTIHIIYKSEKHRAEQLALPFAMGLNMAHDRLSQIKF